MLNNKRPILMMTTLCLLAFSSAEANMKIRSINKKKKEVQILVRGGSEVVVGDTITIGPDCDVEVSRISPKGTRAFAKTSSCNDLSILKVGKKVNLLGEDSSESDDDIYVSNDKETTSTHRQPTPRSQYAANLYRSESETHILKGFKLGFVLAPAITLDVKRDNGTSAKLESSSITGISLGYAAIPKPSFSGDKLGFLLNLEVLTSDFETGHETGGESVRYSSSDNNSFSVINFNLNGVYSFDDQFFGYAGINSPTMSILDTSSSVTLSGDVGLQIGAGAELSDDWSAQLTLARNTYDIEVIGMKVGEASHNMARIEMSYTF